jgi:WhiB family transcriptional regulator, redox-sensing transcriptional regulator
MFFAMGYCQPQSRQPIFVPVRHLENRFTISRRDTEPKGRVSTTAMDWRHQAACRDTDPEIFFPIGTTGPALAQIQAAQSICGTCSVQADCLEWSLSTGQDAGIWGGLTEEERREIRRGARQRVAV